MTGGATHAQVVEGKHVCHGARVCCGNSTVRGEDSVSRAGHCTAQTDSGSINMSFTDADTHLRRHVDLCPNPADGLVFGGINGETKVTQHQFPVRLKEYVLRGTKG